MPGKTEPDKSHAPQPPRTCQSHPPPTSDRPHSPDNLRLVGRLTPPNLRHQTQPLLQLRCVAGPRPGRCNEPAANMQMWTRTKHWPLQEGLPHSQRRVLEEKRSIIRKQKDKETGSKKRSRRKKEESRSCKSSRSMKEGRRKRNAKEESRVARKNSNDTREKARRKKKRNNIEIQKTRN